MLRIVLIFLCFGLLSCQNQSSKPTNVVFILIDDLGWTDLTSYGSNFYETPNIDRLAAEGMRFTNAYSASPVCSPTRASILTGRDPVRINITDWIPGSDPKNRPLLGTKDKHELPLEEKTIAEALKEKDYATAFYGKWHLGDPGFFPEDQGFDINKGGHWAGQPASFYYPYKNKRERWDVPNLEGGSADEYLTDRLTDESLAFIEENQDQAFLLYLAHYAVHTPIQSKEALKVKYEQKLAQNDSLEGAAYLAERESQAKQHQDNASYAGMVQSVDESVGRIMEKLEALGLSENTLIVFASDNGGLSTLPGKRTSPTSVVPLRAGKGWLYEGGIRVPLIFKWPGQIHAGTVSEVPVISADFYPTILEAVNIREATDQALDGKSLMPILTAESDIDRDALYWHFPHYHGSGNKPSAAIRSGDYKLIYWYEDQSIELYNLAEDLGEKNNLAVQEPEKTQQLLQKLKEWQSKMGALHPQTNSDYEVQ